MGQRPGQQRGGKPPGAAPRPPGPASPKRAALGGPRSGAAADDVPAKRARPSQPGSAHSGSATPRLGRPPASLSAAGLEPEVLSLAPRVAAPHRASMITLAPQASNNQRRSQPALEDGPAARIAAGEAAQGSSMVGSTGAAFGGARASASACGDSAASGSAARVSVAAHPSKAMKHSFSAAAEVDQATEVGHKGAAASRGPASGELLDKT